MSAPRILVVCTGNICRSPLGEHALRGVLGDAVDVTSAGVGALVGAPPTEELIRVAADAGLDVRDHRARQLTERIAAEADLVLTMTAEQRSSVTATAPRVTNRAFTFLDAAAVAATLGTAVATDARGRIALLLEALRDARAAGTLGGDGTDVADPYRHGLDAHRGMATVVLPAADRIAHALQ